MQDSGNSFETKSLDAFISEAIKLTLENLKINPPKFQAIFENGDVRYFDSYEESMQFLTENPNCKVYVV